jgi:hypothetical protein
VPARKTKIDSATAAIAVMQSVASGELLPPAHSNLNENALPFWREIIRGRAREEWEATPSLMATAASLAWTQWQVSKLRSEIEDAPLPDAKAVQRVSDLQRLEMGYLRVLQQHGRAAQGEARDVAKRRSASLSLEAQSAEILKDRLLGMPQGRG